MINKNLVNIVMHEEYKNTLFQKKQVRPKKKRIQSNSHTLGTYDVKVFFIINIRINMAFVES